MSDTLPDWIAAVVQHAAGLPAVLGADHAALMVRPGGGGAPTARVLQAQDLDASVLEGRRALLMLDGFERAALVYLAVLRQGGQEKVGLRVDCRVGGSSAMHVFGAPLVVDPQRGPVLGGELWGLNGAAAEALNM